MVVGARGVSQTRVETATRPRSCSRAARRSWTAASAGRPSSPAASATSRATPAEWPRVNGVSKSTMSATAQQVGPDPPEPVGHGRVEPAAGAPPGHLQGRLRTAEPVEDDRLGRDHGEAGRQGDVVAGQPVGVAPAVPALHAVQQPQPDTRAQPQPLGHQGAHLADGPGDGPAPLLAGADRPDQVAGPVDAGAPAGGGQQGQGMARARPVATRQPRTAFSGS